MDLELSYVSKLVLEGGREGLRESDRRGVVTDFFRNPTAQGIFDFVADYAANYDGFPTAEMVEGATGSALAVCAGDFQFYLDNLLKRELAFKMQQHTGKVMDALESRDPDEAYNAYEVGLRDVRDAKIVHARTMPLGQTGDEFSEFYEKLKNGYRGVLTPWPTINETTLGFWPEDLVLIVARLGVGKTWALVNILHAAEQQGKKVLFVSTEMSKFAMYRRWLAVRGKLPYSDLYGARLPMIQEQAMHKEIKSMKDVENVYIVGGDFDFTVAGMDNAINEVEPDLVLVDGAYLIQAGGDGRTEKAANAFDELKKLAKRNAVPVVASMQFNREVKANKANSLSAEKIAMSDAAGWNADLVYGMLQTDDMKQNRRMIIKPLKVREGSGEDVECWWDFDQMRFDEVGGSPYTPGPSGSQSGGGSGHTPTNPPSSGGSMGTNEDDLSTGVFDYGDNLFGEEGDAPF